MKAESVGKKGRNEGEGVGSREIEKIREGTSQRNTASEDYPERRRKRERERESERYRDYRCVSGSSNHNNKSSIKC